MHKVEIMAMLSMQGHEGGLCGYCWRQALMSTCARGAILLAPISSQNEKAETPACR